MEATSAVGAAKMLMPFALRTFQVTKQLHAEHIAAKTPLPLTKDLLSERLQETLDRLHGETVDDRWWRRLLTVVGHHYIAPDFFRKPDVQAWLALPRVREGVKTLARCAILNRTTEEEAAIRKRLADSYSEQTGEGVIWAQAPIDVVVACLAAGYFASIPSGIRPVTEMIQASHGEIVERLEEIKGGLDDPLGRDALRRSVEKDLSDILDLRAFDFSDAITRIATLWQGVDGGDLAALPQATKDEVCYWTTRLLASAPAVATEAREARKALPQDYRGGNVQILDALIQAAEEKGDEAIRYLRDEPDADAKSVLLGLLAYFRGIDVALNWCSDAQPKATPDYFTELGWREWATCLAKSGRWEDAAAGLRVLAYGQTWGPALAMLEGSINAGLLLPVESRDLALLGIPTYRGVGPNLHPSANEWHARAAECFKYVEKNLPRLVHENFKDQVANWRLWLRLMDPDTTVSDDAAQVIRNRLEGGDPNHGLVQLAWSFQIRFNDNALRTRLRERELLGGLDEQDTVVECLLNDMTMDFPDFAQFVEERLEMLDRAVPPSLTTALLFDALLQSGQIERARDVIETRRQHVEGPPLERMEAELEVRQGIDPRERLEARYKNSNDLIDLHNLVGHLREVNDRAALEPRVLELFEREPKPENAREVIRCLRLPPADDVAIVRFLEEYPSVAQRDHDMKSALAWSLFSVGRVDEARHENDTLLDERRHTNDLFLDVEIAIATGGWERLEGIVDREWRHRTDHGPEVLIRLAYLASQGGQSTERAASLARLAAEMAPEDPHVLVAAYAIHFKLGRDEQADPLWLKQASDHSSEEEGPVWSADLRMLVNELEPRLRERNADIDRKLLNGELPMAVALAAVNQPLTQVLLAEPPIGARDGRERRLVPIIAGQQSRTDIQDTWTVGLDITSIMVLARLGLLEKALDALHHAKVAHNAMACLLAEKVEVRFHQPVRVEAARRVITLIDRRLIMVIDRQAAQSSKLAADVGADLATLLEAGRDDHGVVICVRPIHKVGSFMEEAADTSSFDDVILSPSDLCEMAHRGGRLSAAQYERARAFMATQGQMASAVAPLHALTRPVFLDRLALSYLQDARVLDALAQSGLDLRVHPNVLNEAKAFVNAGEHLAELVESIKEKLRHGMESGKVSLMAHPQLSERGLDARPGVSSTQALLFGAGECDALCVDDRFINGHPGHQDATGKPVPVICVLDVLRYLYSCGAISDTELRGAKHRLRDAGFALIPIDAEELLHYLAVAKCDDGMLLESAELRTIRQTVNRANSLGILKLEEALAWSNTLIRICAEVVQKLWLDESISSVDATMLSTWVHRFLSAPTSSLPMDRSDDNALAPYESLVSGLVALLMLPRFVRSPERRSTYRTWLDRCVVVPLSSASPELIDNAASIAQASVEDLPAEHGQPMGALFLEGLPERQRARTVAEHSKFAEDCGYGINLTVSGNVHIVQEAFWNAATIAYRTGRSAVAAEIDGIGEVQVELDVGDGEKLRLTWTDGDGKPQHIEVPEMTLMGDEVGTRGTVAQEIEGRLGPTAGKETRTLLKQAKVRRLSGKEVSVVLDEQATGVAGIQRRLAGGIVARRMKLDDLVPRSMSYWERFCGPVPTNDDPEQYLVNDLIPYRRSLIEADVSGAIDICCLGALRDDLTPGAWLEGADNESVFNALTSMSVGGSPISLLGILDIALHRSDEARFRRLAEEVTRLLLDQRLGFDGYDPYRLKGNDRSPYVVGHCTIPCGTSEDAGCVQLLRHVRKAASST